MRSLCALLMLPLVASIAAAQATNPAPVPYPALATDATVVFHGDSITDGGWLRDSNDRNHNMGQSYPYLVASRLGLELADRNLTFVNRGAGGSGIADIGTDDALKLKPRLVSIATGINDCKRFIAHPTMGSLSAEGYAAAYDKLINDFKTALPATRLVLVAPFSLAKEGSADDATYRAALKPYQEAVARLGAKYGIPVVRLQPAFDEALKLAPARHWCWDGIHPTYAGQALIAREWLQVVAAMPAPAAK